MRYLTRLLAAGALVALSTAEAHADVGDQLAKLLADDGASGDLFGQSVAISGNTAIVGADREDDNGHASGSAYLFDITTGQQIFKLLAGDGDAEDLFGFSVAISGSTAIVGAKDDDDNGTDSGSAYLFDAVSGRQIAKLLPDDGAAFDHFGVSVAISGSTAIVGAKDDDDNGLESGSAYLFDIATGRQIAKLRPDGGETFDLFGHSVAISGLPGKEIAIVGAIGDDDACPADPFCNSGSAYLFDCATGQQLAKLLPNDGAESDFFGYSVAISGATAIVGAERDDDACPADPYCDSGSAYLFDWAAGQQLAKLLPNDGADGDHFGYSVAISGATAIVCAYGDDDNGGNSGSAYLFDATTGEQITKLLPDDGDGGDLFGRSVAISGTITVVGAKEDDDNGSNSGSAYLFNACVCACPWDVNDNGVVDGSDLIIVLGWWGLDPGGPPDFNGDGLVGTADLIELLGNWGPCLE